MSFLIKDKQFLKKYNKIWKKASNIIKKEFNIKLIHNKKNLKRISDIEGPQYIFTPLVLIDSVYIKDKFYPQAFLMEGHYNNVDTEIYSDNSDGGYFDDIYSDEGYFDE